MKFVKIKSYITEEYDVMFGCILLLYWFENIVYVLKWYTGCSKGYLLNY